jgi:hypothetical protein
VLQAIELCGKDSRLRPYCDTSKLLLMGHSRGAKLSCLIAEQVSLLAEQVKPENPHNRLTAKLTGSC